MEHIQTIILFILLCMSAILCGYNIMYTKEVGRIEKTIGVTTPTYIHKLLKIVSWASYVLVAAIFFLTIATFVLSKL